jgi:hypothetical protein
VAIKRKRRKKKEDNLNTEVTNPQRCQAAACPASQQREGRKSETEAVEAY